MDEKELLLKEIQGLIADSQKENVTAKELNDKVEAINKMIAEKLDNAGMAALNTSVEKLLQASAENAAAIKAMAEQAKEVSTKRHITFTDALVAAVMEKSNAPGL